MMALMAPPTPRFEDAAAFLHDLETGALRAAEPDPTTPLGWRVNTDVKQFIVELFRRPGLREWRNEPGAIFVARDRASYGLVDLLDGPAARAADQEGAPIRVVPGGTTVRSGAHLEPGVTLLPPSFVNVGAWVGRGSTVDSHVLVGSCAQIGARVHLSAGVQIGGVLEPVGAQPVIVEDEAFVGGGCGLYEGVIVRRRAVIGAGVVLSGLGRLIDLVEERELFGTAEQPLVVPEGAVVVPGSRPVRSGWGAAAGIAINVPVIVKRRDASTDARTVLEEAIR